MTAEQRTKSPSPSSRRLSLTNRLSAIGAKLTRSVSSGHDSWQDTSTMVSNEDKDSVSDKLPVLTPKERSQSRGREAFSTGRGGLGNIRQGSASRTRPEGGPDDFSISRGREPAPPAQNPAVATKIFSTGRGGAGNIRSPSRDPASPTTALPTSIEESEKEIIRNHIVASQDVPQSTGRGGLGNITGSRSRSRGPALATSGAPLVHSTGRGGAGNISSGDTGIAEALDESERKIRASTTEAPFHSTGRGGLANLASGPQPAVEQVVRPPAAYGSTGRGGAGNIKHNN